MKVLNHSDLKSLVASALKGDADAFAELYFATYEKQYDYAQRYFDDDELAAKALERTYTKALNRLSTLKDGGLFVPWLSVINFATCYELASENGNPSERTASIDGKEYTVNDIVSLPYSESQVMYMSAFLGMSNEAIAKEMEVSGFAVRRSIKNAKKSLENKKGAAIA